MSDTYAIFKRMWDYEGGPGQNDLDQKGAGWEPKKSSTSGVTNWIELDPLAIEHWRRINTNLDAFTVKQKEQYFAQERSGFPVHIVKGKWQQPSIVLGSKSYTMEPGEYNIVKVLDKKNGFIGYETMPYLPGGYDEYSPVTHPWLYSSLVSTDKHNVSHYTKFGKIWQINLDPRGRQHAKGNLSGLLWVEEKFVWKYVSEIPVYVPPVTPPIVTPPAVGFSVQTIRRTWLRQGPRMSANKKRVAQAGERFFVSEDMNGWGDTGNGWVQLKDTKRVPS